LRALDLPTLEPRGAVMAELLIGDRPLRVVGMHLDLSGLWRRAADARDPRSHRSAAAGDADRFDG
jgi:endonuclease/exonuclease/phosphatase family metal-dependent hydrolase